MAQLPIEIIRVGGAPVDNLEAIVVLLNQLQEAFKFSILVDDAALKLPGASDYRFTTAEIYELFDSLKQRIKGYHPYLIGVVERQLDGGRLDNLFGSMKQEGANLQGMAIASLYQIPALLDPVPIDVYVVFELLSFAIRFLHCGIPPLLRPLRFADFRNAEEYQAALGDLIQAIEPNRQNAA